MWMGKYPARPQHPKNIGVKFNYCRKRPFFFLQRSLNPLKKRLRFLALPLWWMCLPHGPFWQLLCNFTVSTTFMVGVSFVEKNSSNGSRDCNVCNIHLRRPDWVSTTDTERPTVISARGAFLSLCSQTCWSSQCVCQFWTAVVTPFVN